MNPLPVLFVSHGSPMMAVEPGVLGPKLGQLGQALQAAHEIKAVLVVSAHWQSRPQVLITGQARPGIIHDFYGFPEALYALDYDSAGSPEWALKLKALLSMHGVAAELSQERGLDHGAWVPLRYLFPKANQAVVQMALPHPLTAQQAYDLGVLLRPLRERGVLVMGSGSLTHNLRDLGSSAKIKPYVPEFTAWIKDKVRHQAVADMVAYRALAPHAAQAHPTEEHFMPLLVALGASEAGDAVTVIEGGTLYEALSMDGFIFAQDGTDYLN